MLPSSLGAFRYHKRIKLFDQRSLNAVKLCDLFDGTVSGSLLEELVELLGDIGTGAETNAVFLGIQRSGIGQLLIALSLQLLK